LLNIVWYQFEHKLGSFGREFLGEGGAADRFQWVKVVSPSGGVTHENWTANYDKLKAIVCGPNGYISHEAARFDHHTRYDNNLRL
jgi:hypothetical protein